MTVPPAGAVYVVPYILFDARTDERRLHDDSATDLRRRGDGLRRASDR